jgi:hypothetical protein
VAEPRGEDAAVEDPIGAVGAQTVWSGRSGTQPIQSPPAALAERQLAQLTDLPGIRRRHLMQALPPNPPRIERRELVLGTPRHHMCCA